ncbi:MAG: tetratricopeptide repeat protein [Planctomycetes bacterium]|nr:tetratricopeptide repeat protein [Planctomycetota bacterium]
MPKSSVTIFVVSFLLSACAGPAPGPRETFEPALFEELAQVRGLRASDRDPEARRLLEDLVRRAPRLVEAHRQLQNLRLEGHERNALLRDYEAKVAAEPDRPEWRYLLGRIRHHLTDQRTLFAEAAQLDADFSWAWHGLAWVALNEGDLAAARGHIETCLRVEPGHLPARLLLVRVLLLQQEAEDALLVVRRILADEPDLAEAWSLAASAAQMIGDRDQELRARARALALDPAAAEDRDRLVQIVEFRPDDPAGRLALDILLAGAARRPLIDEAGWCLALARAHRARHDAAAAERAAARALELDRRDPVLREILEASVDWPRYRALYFATGDREIAAAIEARAAAFEARFGGGPSYARCDALLDEGLSRQAEAELPAAAPATPVEVAIRERVLAHRRVEARLGLLAEQAAEERSEELGADLEVFLARVAAVIEEETGYEAHRGNRILGVPLVGSALDSSLALSGSINGYFRRSRQILYAGRLVGGRVQALLMTIVSGPREVRPEGWRSSRPCQEVVGMMAVIRPREELFGDAGGRALFGNYYLDLDVLLPWQARLSEVLRLDPETRRRLLDDDGLPAATDAERRDLHRPGDAADALTLRAFEIHGELPFVEMVRVHEQGHLLDSQRYLPVAANLVGNLLLVLRNGFDRAAIMAELERAAQLQALRCGPAPHLALAEMVRALPRSDEAGPHSRGYRDLLQAFVDRLAARLDQHPRMRRDRVLIHQLHRLEEAEVRVLAAEL